MGILNATPDSFYSFSRVNEQSIVDAAGEMLEDGADILDIGGYSSRPGADEVSEQEEIDRVIPAIESVLRSNPDIIISVDTFRPRVAKLALEAGAGIINDITGGQFDTDIFKVAGENMAPYILMHMRGTPQTMQKLTDYGNLMLEIQQYFSQQVKKAKDAGVKDILLDPGFGFSKTLDQNYQLMHHLDLLHLHDLPILVGISRKSMIYKKLGSNADQSLNGTTALNMFALTKGAGILRVHDVREAKETISLYRTILGAE
ncbi:MAG: dihydropteroate synthase [Crocinitomicaceae bacterium]|nr:dihydropteroate synthase [Crocinitomicaceae bacterium]